MRIYPADTASIEPLSLHQMQNLLVFRHANLGQSG